MARITATGVCGSPRRSAINAARKGPNCSSAVALHHPLHELQGIEAEELRIAGKAEEVEAFVEERRVPDVARVPRGRTVPLVGEEDEDAAGHYPATAW